MGPGWGECSRQPGQGSCGGRTSRKASECRAGRDRARRLRRQHLRHPVDGRSELLLVSAVSPAVTGDVTFDFAARGHLARRAFRPAAEIGRSLTLYQLPSLEDLDKLETSPPSAATSVISGNDRQRPSRALRTSPEIDVSFGPVGVPDSRRRCRSTPTPAPACWSSGKSEARDGCELRRADESQAALAPSIRNGNVGQGAAAPCPKGSPACQRATGPGVYDGYVTISSWPTDSDAPGCGGVTCIRG